MSISDDEVEAGAEAMWRAEVAQIGAARGARESEYWADQAEEAKSKWRRFAYAALRAAAQVRANSDGDGGAVKGLDENMVRDLVVKHFTPTRHRLTYEQEGTGTPRVSADMLAFCEDFASSLSLQPVTGEAPPSQALRDRVEVLEAALKPFADLGEVVLSEAPAGAVAAWSFAGSAGHYLITLDAFRTARAALLTALSSIETGGK